LVTFAQEIGPFAPDDPDVGRVARLYHQLAGPLDAVVRRAVVSPDGVVEDACQFAWSRLVDNADRMRDETALAWLAQTAIREARRLSRRGARELSLEAALDQGLDPVARGPEPWELVAQRELLERVRELSRRPQRFVWLQALGFSHDEMATHERCTRRTVERQLARGRRQLQAATGTATATRTARA
jgi:DNA-directed RNA polymerase specialized sigma24 family protein